MTVIRIREQQQQLGNNEKEESTGKRKSFVSNKPHVGKCKQHFALIQNYNRLVEWK